ncbi:MAG: YjdF family protein [Liquorilactobacillus satsumensis]|uniref:YjdF family protein n=1 Tax=Lactobacillaceae TaxID=33958 RepID=UPI001E56383C|nr:YjdF family protein [Leuconostoc pseudomesenteroides]MCC8439678.1 hypothetical protein [Leuconostoc pseudomesenteroides]
MLQKITSLSLTIIFDQPFYIGIFERSEYNNYEVSKIILGTSEPRISQIYELIINNWQHIHFDKISDKSDKDIIKNVNPKRMQRLAKKSMKSGVGTKAQEAIKTIRNEKKARQKHTNSEKNQLKKEEQYRISQIKKIQKRKGH